MALNQIRQKKFVYSISFSVSDKSVSEMLREMFFIWVFTFFIPTFQSEVINRRLFARSLTNISLKDGLSETTAAVSSQSELFIEPGNAGGCGDQNCDSSSVPENLEAPQEQPASLGDAEELDTTGSIDLAAAGLGSDQLNPNKTLEEVLNGNATKETLETTTAKMDEVIMLPRNNCNMEIHVNDYEDRKLRIYFSPLENESIGQCQITLNGEEKSMLAVLITEIKLHRSEKNDRDCVGDEILRVVLTNTGINFTVKQYCGEEDHYPVILTDTNRVYLILSYNVKGMIPELQESSFSLEAFTYEKNENNITLGQNENLSTFYGNSPSGQNVDNVYFTTDTPVPLNKKKR